jgi:hypothetical protein
MESPTPITGRLQAAFEEFHRNNPHVYEVLESLASEWLAGRQVVGIGMLWEVMRWRIGVQSTGDEYQLNNSYRSRYARLLLANHPEWTGRIRTRQLQAA